MRVMVFVKEDKSSETGVLPPEELVASAYDSPAQSGR